MVLTSGWPSCFEAVREAVDVSKVLIITTSLRARSNTDILAGRLIAGAKDAGHEAEQISLKGKEIKFCIGCLACQKTRRCVLKDDAVPVRHLFCSYVPFTLAGERLRGRFFTLFVRFYSHFLWKSRNFVFFMLAFFRSLCDNRSRIAWEADP